MISSNHVTMVCVWRMESHGQCLMSQDQCQGLSYNLKLMLPSDDEKLMNRLQEWISLLGATNKLKESAMKTRHSEISWFSNLSTRDSVGHPNSQKQVPIDQACYVSFWMLDSHRTYIDQASDQSSWKCYGLSVCVCAQYVFWLSSFRYLQILNAKSLRRWLWMIFQRPSLCPAFSVSWRCHGLCPAPSHRKSQVTSGSFSRIWSVGVPSTRGPRPVSGLDNLGTSGDWNGNLGDTTGTA